MTYEFSMFKPLLGLYTYERNDLTLGIGFYEDDCLNRASNLPFGIGNFNEPSYEEISGQSAQAGKIWVNDEDGTSTYEINLFDSVRDNEETIDTKVVIEDEAW